MPHERADYISMFEAKLANPLRVLQRLASTSFKEAHDYDGPMMSHVSAGTTLPPLFFSVCRA